MRTLPAIVLFALILLAAGCGESGDNQPKVKVAPPDFAAKLGKNNAWPYQAVGTLFIVEAGGYELSNYPQWAVGEFTADGEAGKVSIDFQAGVIARALVNIDSGRQFRVWLEAPRVENGAKIYPISKIEYVR